MTDIDKGVTFYLNCCVGKISTGVDFGEREFLCLIGHCTFPQFGISRVQSEWRRLESVSTVLQHNTSGPLHEIGLFLLLYSFIFSKTNDYFYV